ncbi:complement factor D-like [Plodia interpunctella]|uniref:complement factor D-like n=1 Tax=Plodia interpunctella TaxID=58824 RepID=UPI002368B429|nr:complement factor D-like [Plodia interpunctella]XP_053621454.1 complement factor D-like [Plodia interpunctella]
MARRAVWGLLLLNIHGLSASHLDFTRSRSRPKQPRLTFVAFLTSQDGGVVCSGTVIHESFVLTAAACFHTDTGDMISYQHKVLVGDEYKAIRQLVPHPSYRLQRTFFDVGLIKVSTAIRLGAAVSLIKMAAVEQMEVGDMMKTTCWIMDASRSWLKQERSHIVMRSLCKNAPISALGLFGANTMVCAIVQRNKCYVNRGSPLYDGGKQYGVAVKNIEDHTTYIKVSKIRPWIINILYKNYTQDFWE